MPLRFPTCILILFVLTSLMGTSAQAYTAETYGFKDADPIVMQLELGPTSVVLEDGSKTWDGSAANALSL